MANYALTVTPKFTPFTYDELIKPIETYQKVYDTYDATYEKAAEDAAKFASLDAEKNPIAYQRYQNYLQNIQKQRDALYKSGLSNNTRRGFQDLRSTYSTEIKPMEIAYDKKLEDIKNYDKLIMTNPQMRAVRNPHETSLDEYMTNDELGNRYIDLNIVEKSAADAFSKAREKVVQYGHLDAETRDIITRVGLTPGEILVALDNAAKGGNTNAAKTINRIREEVRNQFGYYEIDNDSVRNDIDSTIIRAAWNLRGDETHQYVPDAGAKRALDNAEWYTKENYKHSLELDKIQKQAEIKAREESKAQAGQNIKGALTLGNTVLFANAADSEDVKKLNNYNVVLDNQGNQRIVSKKLQDLEQQRAEKQKQITKSEEQQLRNMQSPYRIPQKTGSGHGPGGNSLTTYKNELKEIEKQIKQEENDILNLVTSLDSQFRYITGGDKSKLLTIAKNLKNLDTHAYEIHQGAIGADSGKKLGESLLGNIQLGTGSILDITDKNKHQQINKENIGDIKVKNTYYVNGLGYVIQGEDGKKYQVNSSNSDAYQAYQTIDNAQKALTDFSEPTRYSVTFADVANPQNFVALLTNIPAIQSKMNTVPGTNYRHITLQVQDDAGRPADMVSVIFDPVDSHYYTSYLSDLVTTGKITQDNFKSIVNDESLKYLAKGAITKSVGTTTKIEDYF